MCYDVVENLERQYIVGQTGLDLLVSGKSPVNRIGECRPRQDLRMNIFRRVSRLEYTYSCEVSYLVRFSEHYLKHCHLRSL